MLRADFKNVTHKNKQGKVNKNTTVAIGLTVLDFEREYSRNYGTIVLAANIPNIGETLKLAFQTFRKCNSNFILNFSLNLLTPRYWLN